MADFTHLLPAISPDEAAACKEYQIGIEEIHRHINGRIRDFNMQIKRLKKMSRRQSEINDLKYKIECLQRRLGSPEAYAFEENIPCKSFLELPLGAKQYLACCRAIAMAKEAGKPEAKKVAAVLEYIKRRIADRPLTYDSINACLEFSGNWSFLQKRCAAAVSPTQDGPGNKSKHVSLTKFFKSRFCNDYMANLAVISQCDVSRDAGCLPPEWIARIPQGQTAAQTRAISALLQNFAKATYSMRYTPDYLFADAARQLGEGLSKILNCRIDVSFLNEGAIGKVFKITTADENRALVLKINHANPQIRPADGHGTQIETAIGIFASHSNDRKKFAKNYFGRIGDARDTTSFLLSRFVDRKKNEEEETNVLYFPQAVDQIQSADDHYQNLVGAKRIDVGGCYIKMPLRDKQTYRFFNTLFRALQSPDGDKTIAKIRHICSRRSDLQEKLNDAVRHLNTVLEWDMPDIDDNGQICNYGLRRENMVLLGVDNQTDLIKALNICSRCPQTMDYLVSSRGGPDGLAEKLSQFSNCYIAPEISMKLIERGVGAEACKKVSMPCYYALLEAYQRNVAAAADSGKETTAEDAKTMITRMMALQRTPYYGD